MLLRRRRLANHFSFFLPSFLSVLAIAAPRVSFHARLETDLNNFTGRLEPFTVMTNEGNAFSGELGLFTVPVSGIYFFVGSAGTSSTEKGISIDLQADGTSLSYAFTHQYSIYDTMGTCHAAVHLTVGQQVWLQSLSYFTFYASFSTSFTGFLLSADD